MFSYNNNEEVSVIPLSCLHCQYVRIDKKYYLGTNYEIKLFRNEQNIEIIVENVNVVFVLALHMRMRELQKAVTRRLF